MCQYPPSHSPSHLPEGSSDLGWLSTALECPSVKHWRKDGVTSRYIWLGNLYAVSTIQDLPTAQWGVHGCGQILVLGGFLPNSEKLCYSYDE